MTSTIKVNNIQNQCGANIINENSNTITIGASGDTIALASGASQTGFGREGSVNWQTGSLKTATFTAVSGEGYFINQGSAITMNLPAGSAGAIVAVSDYARNFATYNLTISPNGSEKIGGIAEDATLAVNGQAATFVYVDSTKGWINVQNAEDTETGVPPFITASGGTETTCGNFKIHTFTGPGTFAVSYVSQTAADNTVGYQVVAGGGSGGFCVGGGGGAGGFREGRNVPVDNFTASPLVANAPTNAVTITAQNYPIVVGAGGASPLNSNTPGTNGSVSTFDTITSAGGGGGGSYDANPANGLAGGSGGGGGGWTRSYSKCGGAGNTPPTTPSQGSNGGNGPPTTTQRAGGGGGGAGGVGGNSPPDTGPPSATPTTPAGAGVASSITGSSVTRAAGGLGANDNTVTPGNAGAVNTGEGGFGAGAPTPAFGAAGATGGSGIVIIRYKYQ